MKVEKDAKLAKEEPTSKNIKIEEHEKYIAAIKPEIAVAVQML